MIAAAKILPLASCVFLLLCVASCDHAWSSLTGPNGLGAATRAMHGEVDDGTEDPMGHDDVDDAGSPDSCPKARTWVCCGCNGRSCTKEEQEQEQEQEDDCP